MIASVANAGMDDVWITSPCIGLPGGAYRTTGFHAIEFAVA